MRGEWNSDLSEWPVALIAVEGGAGRSMPSFESFEAAVDHVLMRRERFGVILDTSGARPDAKRRRQVVELVEARRETLERWVGAGAIVAPSAFHRGILTAVRWLNPRPLRIAWDSFATVSQARTWVRATIDAPRRSPPPL